MNSGPGGAWRRGSWDGLVRGPVLGWRAWLWDGALVTSSHWGGPLGVLAVCVYTDRGPDRPIGRTFMAHVDEYPAPPGVEGEPMLGEQVGEVGGPEWQRLYRLIRSDPWLPER